MTDEKAYILFKKMHKKICPKCITKDDNCPKCEGHGYLFKITDGLMKEIKK